MGGASSSTATGLPEQFTITGVVQDADGAPVEGAIVLQGGRSTEPTQQSGSDGSFAIELSQGDGVATVVATKRGFRSQGSEIYILPTEPLVLTLYAIAPPDNVDYRYGEPGEGGDPSTNFCGHCHALMTQQFQQSGHAHATRHELLQDLYAGVSRAHDTATSCEAAGGTWRRGRIPGTASDGTMKCYLGAGVLPDLNPACGGAGQPACDDPQLPVADAPDAFGGCADCHAPGIDGVAGGRDLHEATGIAFSSGVSCDPCHKVAGIDMTQRAGVGGRLMLGRPNETNPDDSVRNVFYGPLLDVPNGFMGGSLVPSFAASTYCAGCHEHDQPALIPGEVLASARWPDGLPIHSTYSEWLQSPAAARGEPCQGCHMAPIVGLYNTLDVATPEDASLASGFARPPEQIRSHRFEGALDGEPRMIDGAVDLQIAIADIGGAGRTIEITVTANNRAEGHAVPTGEPLRSLVLVVDAACDATAMTPTGGPTIEQAGGARATAIMGSDATAAGVMLTWTAGAALAQPGQIVRAVRATRNFQPYPGIGIFADPRLSPTAKGIAIMAPVGQASVVGVSGATLTLDAALPLAPGDVLYLGDAWPSTVADAEPARQLAGLPGLLFARTLLDASGRRHVPHHLAVDIASDNRLSPAAPNISRHRFTTAGACSEAIASATLLYRRVPPRLALERGWDAPDYLVAAAEASLTF